MPRLSEGFKKAQAEAKVMKFPDALSMPEFIASEYEYGECEGVFYCKIDTSPDGSGDWAVFELTSEGWQESEL